MQQELTAKNREETSMRIERLYLKDYFPELGENDANAYMNCYLPDTMAEKESGTNPIHPAMVICPGGGYGMVSNREAEPIALKFLEMGFSVFVVWYSVKPHFFPQQLLEVAGAMELIHRNADEWEVDSSNISIIGFSAGGHLACQYSNRYDCPEIKAVFPESRPVKSAVLCYPVITQNPTFTHRGTMFNFVGGHEPVDGYELGCGCEHLVSEKTPPTFLWHTAEDASVPVENSLIYASALSAHKIPFELHVYPFGHHGLGAAEARTCKNWNDKLEYCHQWIGQCKKWLKEIGII